MTQNRVVVVGSVNLDRSALVSSLPRPGETVLASEYRIATGGKGANQAVASARLGAAVSLSASVGADGDASKVVRDLERNGVDVSNVRHVKDAPTGTALIAVDGAGENSIVVVAGANGKHALGEHPDLLTEAGIVVSLSLEVPLSTVEAAARSARASGATVISNLSPFRSGLEPLIAVSSVIVLNEHEAAALSDSDSEPGDLTAFARWFETTGADAAIVTLGAQGAAVFVRGAKTARVASPSVRAVDTTGCGDAFAGALAAELAVGVDLLDAARFACACAAYAATGFGAQASYPTRADVAALLAAN